MTSNDSQANNLFSRLISYTPRVCDGGTSRTALEDYYTEALAWCLRNSKECLQAFLVLIQQDLAAQTKSKLPVTGISSPAIHTQFNFDSESDDEDEEPSSSQRRFDLVICSENDETLVIVLENKVRWKFTDGQIPAYIKALKTGVFKTFHTKVLIVLSPRGEKPESTDGIIPIVPLKWHQIQRMLADVSLGGEQKPLYVSQIICGQFAEFLQKKGLAPMNLVKTYPSQQFKDGIHFTYQIQQILLQIRENTDLKDVLSSKVHLKHWDDGCLWFSMGSKPGKSGFTLYFKMWSENKMLLNDKRMLVEASWINRPNILQSKFDKQKFADNNIIFEEWPNKKGFSIFGQFTAEYDGNADRIREWYEEAVALTSALLEDRSAE